MNSWDRLQLLAGCLGDGTPEAVVRAALAREDDWPAFALLASAQLVSPAIGSELIRRRLSDALPEDFRFYLEGLRELNLQRNNEILQQLSAALADLNAIDLEPVLLKGSAVLATKLYPDPSARIISDLDILVPEDKVTLAGQALQRSGYQRISNPQRDAQLYDVNLHHDAPLIHPELPAAVELHRRRVLPRRGQQLFDLLQEKASLIQLSGARARVPDPTHLLAHNFLHQMVQDSAYVRGVLMLRQLFEATLLVGRYRDQINWTGLLAAVAKSRCGEEWGAFAISLHRLFAVEIPYGSASPLRSGLWFERVRLQYRWPQLWRFNQWVYRRLRPLVPRWARQRFGWDDHGWLLMKAESASDPAGQATRSKTGR